MDEALRVREFWFGKAWTGALPPPADREGLPRANSLAQRASVWFETDPRLLEQHDEWIRSEFNGLVERAARGELAGWADSPRRRLSLIILLDQFPRHIHRGRPQAFAWDEQALSLALSGMQSAADAALNVVERIFFYMPLQHAESQDVQEESVAAYRRLVAECPADLRTLFEESLESARSHRELIKQFGRFPHRNRVLGRASTAAEEIWLRANPDRFGQ
ncbi:MAG TPA: DUF924 family protein [Steroidobacteraceae bacterium]|nr:DUF924 family protein [Steroidobacteraceae bacterium]